MAGSLGRCQSIKKLKELFKPDQSLPLPVSGCVLGCIFNHAHHSSRRSSRRTGEEQGAGRRSQPAAVPEAAPRHSPQASQHPRATVTGCCIPRAWDVGVGGAGQAQLCRAAPTHRAHRAPHKAGGTVLLVQLVPGMGTAPWCSTAVPCRAVPCCAMPCHALPCHAMPCRAVPCHAVPFHGRAPWEHPQLPGSAQPGSLVTQG